MLHYLHGLFSALDLTSLLAAAVRVAAGIKEDGSLVLVVANTTLSTLSQILVDLGCEDAINFDGGGSSNLYVDGQWLYGPQERLLNTLLYFK